MFQKLAVLSYLIIFTTCTVLNKPLPWLDSQYHSDPNYNFAYDVNNPHTGDIKNQHESRRGDTVVGEYSLVQPDGVRRTVEYRADHHAGFRATVNNEGRPVPPHVNPQEASQRPVNQQGWDAPQRSNVHQPSWDAQRPYGAAHQRSWDAPQRSTEVVHQQSWDAPQRPNVHQPSWDAQRPNVEAHQQSWDAPQRSTEVVHQQSWDAPQRSNVNAHKQGWIPWPTPAVLTSPAPAPVAVSRTSIHQTIANVHHPWI